MDYEYNEPTTMKHHRARFSLEEDEKLKRLVEKFGTEKWDKIARRMSSRNARQVKDRWIYYLSPELNQSEWSEEEDNLLIEKHEEIGNKWRKIALFFPNRTDIMVKSRFHKIMRFQCNKKKINSLKKDKPPEPIIIPEPKKIQVEDFTHTFFDTLDNKEIFDESYLFGEEQSFYFWI